MSLTPIHAEKGVIIKDSSVGNKAYFSTGKQSETITLWEVWNSKTRSQVQSASKIYTDETRCILRTHDKLAEELQTDDSVIFKGYNYSIQSIAKIKTALSFNSYDWEIQVK